jgi:PPP family 3-phenylpropionic acid transporter
MLTAKYAGIQGMYFGALAPVGAFASAFLLYKGFTNSQIGILISLGSIGSAILQMAMGNLAGRSRGFSVRAMIFALVAGVIALSLTLLFIPFGIGMTAVAFVALQALALAMAPLVSSMNFLFADRGIMANYGMARAAGSIMYAILAAIIGSAVARYSAGVIPLFNVLAFGGMFFFVAIYALPKDVLQALPPRTNEADAAAAQGAGRTGFLRRNRDFLVFLVGVALVYLSNATPQTYFLQIITPKGGDSASLGVIMSIGATLEVPMMVGFVYLHRKIKCSVLIQTAMLFFTLKAVGLLLAPTVTAVYFVQCLNMLGFAMFTPASVYYVAQIMGEGDRVKGQAYLGSAIAISGICANFAGGRILDAYGPGTMLQCVIALSLLGNVIVILAARAMRKKEDHDGAPAVGEHEGEPLSRALH